MKSLTCLFTIELLNIEPWNILTQKKSAELNPTDFLKLYDSGEYYASDFAFALASATATDIRFSWIRALLPLRPRW